MSSSIGLDSPTRFRWHVPRVHLPWVAYLATSPAYLLPPGAPQLSDLLLAGGIAVWMLSGDAGVPRRFAVPLGIFWCFVGYGWLLATWVTIDTRDFDPIIRQSFFVYNAVVLTYQAALAARSPRLFLRSTFVGACVAVAVAMAGVILTFDPAQLRQLGTYNNPNQLAYFSILSSTSLILAVTSGAVVPKGARWPWFVVGVAVLSGVAGASVGWLVSWTGGLVAIALYGVIDGRRLLRTARLATVGLFLAATGGAWLLATGQLDRIAQSTVATALQAGWGRRLRTLGETVATSAESRGYDRPINHPQYLAFGASRGAPWRFGSTIEIHSSYISILFSFGLVGTALMLAYFGWFVANTRLDLWLLTAPIWLYSVTHYGLNQPLFWAQPILLWCVTQTLRPAAHRSGVSPSPRPIVFAATSDP